MFQNQFYNQFLNQKYVNPEYYNQNQDQIDQYRQKQDREVKKVGKAVRDMCEAVKCLDDQHQEEAFGLALAILADEFGWNNR